jgi:hypothetical protein
MYYNGLNFTPGANKIAPSLEYSIRGGGGNEIQPYQYVGSLYFSANRVNSIKLPQTDNSILSSLTNNKKFFALSLDASMANPDVNKDGNFVDQGALSPVLTNARLRLTGDFTLNGETLPLQTEGPLFTINPLSNFTLRVMLEGYHQGNVAGRTINNIGSEYDRGGLRIKLYTDNSGEIGKFVAETQSTNGYTELNTNNLNKSNMRFGNVDFVFTNIADGSYWVIIEHINHLPVMSRYPVPFIFTGDNPLTWAIESGWDFMSWNGVDDNIMPSPNANIYAGSYYSARGNAINNRAADPERYSTTGLIYTGGTNNSNGLAGMVGGDVNQDNMINAADRVIVRQEAGTMSYRSDITGDRYVNAVDRTIVDKNYGKVSSLINVNIAKSSIIKQETPKQVQGDIDFSSVMPNLFRHPLDNKQETPKQVRGDISYTKHNDQLQAFRYNVSAKSVYNDSGYVDLSIYIRNQGDPFAPANCTFPVLFDTNQVSFVQLLGSDSVIFNSEYDYSNLDSAKYNAYINNVVNGYLTLNSAPRTLNSQAYKDIRTIEIDYDATANIGGINCPNVATYLGTLRFKVKNGVGSVAFSWHNSKAVLTTKGEDITDDGIWDSISNILLYTGRIIQPNGGEEYSIRSTQIIKWTTTKDAKIHIDFSSNNGYNWQRLTDIAISSSLNQMDWIIPSITSNICLVRIVDAATGIEVDRSDNVFSIISPWGNILKPYASNEVNRGGSATTIEWLSGGTSCVRFEFSSNGGASWEDIKGTYNAKTGKTNWTYPRVTTKNALVRMFDCESNMLLSTSGRFIILNGTFTFTTPSQGQLLNANKNFTIRWTKQYIDMFDLDVSLDSGRTWQRLASDVAGNNMNWVIANFSTDSAYFRALYQGDPTMEYGRSKFFRIRVPNYINDLPDNSYISEVFPNPTSSIASIKLYFESPVVISTELIKLDGSKVLDVIDNEYIDAGEQIINFDLKNLVSGKYYLLIKSNKFIVVREVVVGK